MIRKASIFDLITGVLMVAIGVCIWFNPIETLVALSLYLGITLVVVGGVYVIKFFDFDNVTYLTFGILDIVIGFVMILNTSLVATSLPIILGFWILFNSIIQITNSIEYKKLELPFWSYELTAGILGTVFSLTMLTHPTIGALTIVIIAGTYIVLFGLVEIYEYYLLKKLGK